MIYASEDDWNEFLLTDSKLCLKVYEEPKTVDASALGIKN